MKLQRTAEGITVTNYGAMAKGVILAILTPVAWGCVLFNVAVMWESLAESWFLLFEIAVLAVMWGILLSSASRQRMLTYAYVFDRDGVREKRLIGKGKCIPWTDMGEYICVYIGYKGKTYMPIYCVTFASAHTDKPVAISTPPFPETQLPVFRDQLLAACDSMRAAAMRR